MSFFFKFIMMEELNTCVSTSLVTLSAPSRDLLIFSIFVLVVLVMVRGYRHYFNMLAGYPHEPLNPVPNDYECSICHLLLREPQQIVNCGHRFCQGCLEPVLRKDPPQCPLDRQEIEVDKVFTDQACHRAILCLEVKCLNSIRGCLWTGELLRAIREHQDECLYEKVKCINEDCDKDMERREIETHLKDDCQWTLVQCSHCKQDYAKCKKNEHINECPMLPIACLNNCDITTIARIEMNDHIKNHCPLTVLECTYSQSGCNIKMKRMELQKHLNISMQFHLDLIYKRQIAMELQNEEFKVEVQKMTERLNELERQPTKYDGKFLWRINKYEQRLEDAKSGKDTDPVFSDGFYSGRYGYQFKCCVALNGDGDAKGSYMSVYLIIMRGKFDSLLPWPYSNKIVFTLMDQRHDEKDRKNIVMDIVPDVTLAGYSKPESDLNPGVGIWKFVTHEDIVNEGFLRDEQIFLKCEVEPFDIFQENSD